VTVVEAAVGDPDVGSHVTLSAADPRPAPFTPTAICPLRSVFTVAPVVTVKTLVSADAMEHVRPVSATLPALHTLTVIVPEAFRDGRVSDVGEKVMLPMDVRVMTSDPDPAGEDPPLPWFVAVATILTVPESTAVASPLVLTVAFALEADQVKVTPESVAPVESCAVALNCVACPVCTVAEAGATVTLATGTGLTTTVIGVVAGTPSTLAVTVVVPTLSGAIVALPGAPAVTLAIVESVDVHTMVRPLKFSRLDDASYA